MQLKKRYVVIDRQNNILLDLDYWTLRLKQKYEGKEIAAILHGQDVVVAGWFTSEAIKAQLKVNERLNYAHRELLAGGYTYDHLQGMYLNPVSGEAMNEFRAMELESQRRGLASLGDDPTNQAEYWKQKYYSLLTNRENNKRY